MYRIVSVFVARVLTVTMWHFVMQTDDKGVFATSLSQEYAVAAETFNLTRENLWDLSYDSINYIFADDTVKDQLRAAWNHLKSDCFKS